MNLPVDKAAHFLAGTTLVLALAPVVGPLYALGVCAAAAVGKEVADRFTRGTPDVNDAIATAVGGLVALVWVLAV